jgi:hypothetical protein
MDISSSCIQISSNPVKHNFVPGLELGTMDTGCAFKCQEMSLEVGEQA